jgi:hypothetical protein
MQLPYWCLAGPLLLGPVFLASAAQEEPRNLFEKAPPDVEQALKSRVAKFYQYFVEGKFRLADALVAEESKDVFFAAEKRKYKDFSVGSPKYSDNFTKATVVTSCGTDYSMMGNRMDISLPVLSFWKIENGEWFWYVPPPGDKYFTPLGEMPRPKEGPGNMNTTQHTPIQPVRPMISPEQIMKAVRADRDSVVFNSSKASTQEVHLKNTLPGSVSVSSTTAIRGLTITPAKTNLNTDEEVTVVISFDPKDPSVTCDECLAHPQDRRAGQVTMLVQPTGQQIPIAVLFIVPPPAPKQEFKNSRIQEY